jgi:hypothetical protein
MITPTAAAPALSSLDPNVLQEPDDPLEEAVSELNDLDPDECTM